MGRCDDENASDSRSCKPKSHGESKNSRRTSSIRRRRRRDSDGESSSVSDEADDRKTRHRSRRSRRSSNSSNKRRHHRHRHSNSRSRSRSRSASASVSSDQSSSGHSSSEDEARQRKRLRKQKKQADKMLASFGYSNDTNPFGDSNLSQPFVWSKKFEHQKKQLPKAKELQRQQQQRMDEIHKARERREAREAEREEMERLKQEEMRLRDAEQFEDWQTKEEEFHLNQTKVRSKLRIAEQREKPVDLLAKNYLLVSHLLDEEEEKEFFDRQVLVEKREPYEIVSRLALYELEELKDNIKAYQELENKQQEQQSGRGETSTGEFWKLMMLICCDRIRQFKRRTVQQGDNQELATMGDANAIHGAVQKQILAMLEGKTLSQLRDLKYDVEKTIESASTTSGVDVEYWEEVGRQIEVFEARTRLKQLHEEMLDKLADHIQAHEDNKESEYRRRREADPRQSGSGGVSGMDESREALEMQHLEESKGLEDSEERMDAAEEIDVQDSSVGWSEKYKPRKPRYFNRVKTGYDWNKYNQTHYDHDNPPPKVVQGYKFNLFYPDLIDKTKAPRFFLEKANHPDFCILRFHAGPPYHDIAFKIVNREWEYSHKRGFKSVFERGILHLYFNFKRHRYRR